MPRYGDELGRKILADETDRALEITPALAPRRGDSSLRSE